LNLIRCALIPRFAIPVHSQHILDRGNNCEPHPPDKAAALVCKFYSQYCKKSLEDDMCEKEYVSSSFKRNPNSSYPGTGVRRSDYGSTLLIDMVSSGDVAAAEAIINRGADVNQSMGGNWTPLTSAKYNSEMIEMLKRHGGQ